MFHILQIRGYIVDNDINIFLLQSKLTPAQKAMAKVDKSNTKLTNFFSKKSKK